MLNESFVDYDFNYEYHCGASVFIKINGNELDAVGISYQVSYSKQPIYSYFSKHYDAVLDGKHLVQGRIVLNFKKARDLFNGDVFEETVYNDLSEVPFFNINIQFDKGNTIVIQDCFFMGSGQTIQIDDQVILTEYNFIGRKITSMNP